MNKCMFHFDRRNISGTLETAIQEGISFFYSPETHVISFNNGNSKVICKVWVSGQVLFIKHIPHAEYVRL